LVLNLGFLQQDEEFPIAGVALYRRAAHISDPEPFSYRPVDRLPQHIGVDFWVFYDAAPAHLTLLGFELGFD
jgi:hypothetical protein